MTIAASHVYCDLPFRRIHVAADGRFRHCCHQAEHFGNVLTDDLGAALGGGRVREVREATLRGDVHRICEQSRNCPHLFRPRVPTLPIPAEEGWGFPDWLELDLPNTECNVGGEAPTAESACLMCPRGAPGFKPDADRTLEIVARLRVLLPRLRVLQIQGLAEVFWKDRIFAVLEMFEFEKHKSHVCFAAFTNGTVFTAERRARFLGACQNSGLNFSIDAATPETYRKIRRLDLFDRVVENIRDFVAERPPGHIVSVANNLNELNLHEAVQMVELAHELKVDRLLMSPTNVVGGTRSNLSSIVVSRESAARFKAAQHRILRRCQELGVYVEFMSPLDRGLA